MSMEASYHAHSSSSEEEAEGKTGIRSRQMIYQTPLKSPITRAATTPSTVTEMTPSPIRNSFSHVVSSNPGTEPSRSLEPTPTSHESFLTTQHGYLENHNIATNLFQDTAPCRTRRKRRSFPTNKSRLSQSLLLDGYTSPALARGMERRRSVSSQKLKPLGRAPSIESFARDVSSMDSSPKGSPDRGARSQYRNLSWIKHELFPQYLAKHRGRTILFLWAFVALSLTCSLETILLTRSAVRREHHHELSRQDLPLSAAGLRGPMTSGHWEDKNRMEQRTVHVAIDSKNLKERPKEKHSAIHHKHLHQEEDKNLGTKIGPASTHDAGKAQVSTVKENHSRGLALPTFHFPPPASIPKKPKFEIQDSKMYSTHASKSHRVVALDPFFRAASVGPRRSIKIYPADFTDNTQLYSILESSDERLGHMEPREPYSEGECVPMQEWQTTFHPICNGMHEIAMENMGEDNGNDVNLFGTKGFWRYAWRLDVQNAHEHDTVVLKTLK